MEHLLEGPFILKRIVVTGGCMVENRESLAVDDRPK
jgi:hypothetical protein